MRERVCPICKAKLEGQRARDAFCSERCRTIDLGHWLDERYRVPDETRFPVEPNEEPPS